MLVLPNVWEAASAEIMAEAGFPAVATTSAAIAAMLGYRDGEGAPWPEMFAAAGRIARAVAVPVTVDAEAGYGLRPRELVDRLLEIGAVGCNLEDTEHRAGGLADVGAQAERLAAVRAAAGDAGVPIVVNARVDVFLPGAGVPEEERVAEASVEAAATWRPGPTASTRSVPATSGTSPHWSPKCPGRSTRTPGRTCWTWSSSVRSAWCGSPMAPGSTAKRGRSADHGPSGTVGLSPDRRGGRLKRRWRGCRPPVGSGGGSR
jgi:hypothetical protein